MGVNEVRQYIVVTIIIYSCMEFNEQHEISARSRSLNTTHWSQYVSEVNRRSTSKLQKLPQTIWFAMNQNSAIYSYLSSWDNCIIIIINSWVACSGHHVFSIDMIVRELSLGAVSIKLQSPHIKPVDVVG